MKSFFHPFVGLFVHPFSDGSIAGWFRSVDGLSANWAVSAEDRKRVITVDTVFATDALRFAETFKFFDFGFALDDYFLSIGEEVANGGGDQLIEDVKFHDFWLIL